MKALRIVLIIFLGLILIPSVLRLIGITIALVKDFGSGAANASYESHLSREAVAFVVGLSKKKQKVVLDLADQIAWQPFHIGDYRTVDAVGQTIENLRLEGYLFSYWVDHGSREVRITEIVRL